MGHDPDCDRRVSGSAYWLVLFIGLAISLRWEAIPALFFTLLVSAGVYLCFTASVQEIKARKLRKAKGLPKPWFAVTDDRARCWFEKNPHLGIAITKENYPGSTKPFA